MLWLKLIRISCFGEPEYVLWNFFIQFPAIFQYGDLFFLSRFISHVLFFKQIMYQLASLLYLICFYCYCLFLFVFFSILNLLLLASPLRGWALIWRLKIVLFIVLPLGFQPLVLDTSFGSSSSNFDFFTKFSLKCFPVNDS